VATATKFDKPIKMAYIMPYDARMDRDLLQHLPVILCVGRHRGFAAAAAELGMSPSAVSRAVRMVEDRLGVPLFARTTRSVSLTETGARFIAGVAPALTDIARTVEGLTAERGEVTGLLRIDSPRIVLDMALTQILAKLARQHPRLTVEVRTGQTSVDIVAQGFDAGIRIRRAIQQDMVTTRLTGSFKVILVASRDYLDARGTPASITDLHQHNCIGIRSVVSGAIFDWELIDRKKPTTMKTSGTALVTDMTEALSLALSGVGIAYVVEPLARRYLREASLEWLLPQAAVEHDGLFIYYPRRASLAPKLRAFIDVAKKTLKSIE
jgi:DNA-binding transcriptional LysR family regulator